jgi:hypothetical protein
MKKIKDLGHDSSGKVLKYESLRSISDTAKRISVGQDIGGLHLKT